ncbi:hypothetical protein PC116_g19226 [Phytophthora cactorum]|uniref:Uncharacterized protein n=1 Tax=Phytophthora cactorum TaxID=29920 RepID=A0A8T1CGQ6_9STRA|nr:hypothetical protein PC114_g12545 [Phytophthora cactorum]KAG2922487.1 hypothetical protein PC117_g15967 [Phytophthora cactorum]KAG2980244.1 hypothetical protein PC120_g25001 [Phytophthora cactorum]KAG3003290.1 hypothetical protein PC119_g16075 [Phytophthora cactorum]KAG3044343.1 hypothetical protein PC121_g21964 [Phytophthora cactorum]
MKLVELYCMSVDMAILEAAATGQIERLNRLMPRFGGSKEDLGCKLTELAAAHARSEMIRVVYKGWKSSGESGGMSCARALSITAVNGHLEVMKCLLGRYGIDTLDPLKQALNHGHNDIVEVICEEMDP